MKISDIMFTKNEKIKWKYKLFKRVEINDYKV